MTRLEQGGVSHLQLPFKPDVHMQHTSQWCISKDELPSHINIKPHTRSNPPTLFQFILQHNLNVHNFYYIISCSSLYRLIT